MERLSLSGHALNSSFLGMYATRIHTLLDKQCREENINFLTDAMIKFIEKVGNKK